MTAPVLKFAVRHLDKNADLYASGDFDDREDADSFFEDRVLMLKSGETAILKIKRGGVFIVKKQRKNK